MTQRQNYSYLDLAVHAALSPCVLSPDAAVLFSSDLKSILWANAAGAQLFGGKGVVELLDAKINDEQSFVRQLRDSIRQIVDDEPIIRGFRINQGLRSALLQFEIIPVRFRDGNTCYKVVQKASPNTIEPSENVLATDAVESLVGFADATAIVDDYGLPIAVSSAFGRLGPADDVLAALVHELANEHDKLIKRPIIGASGRKVVAGLGRIATQPGRNLIVLADAADEGSEQHSEPTLSLLSEIPQIQTAPILQTEPDTEISKEVVESNSEIQVDEHEAQAPEQIKTDDNSSDIAPIVQQASSYSLDNAKDKHDLETETETETEDEIPTESTQTVELKSNDQDTSTDEPFAFSANEENTRFAWSIDEQGVFTHVSSELAETVGPKAADIIGRKWDDIATIFGFDTSGEISSLLSKKDTWSGKSVLWPIEGMDMVVPVDLAALPAFGPERRFDGFRGFGVIRTLDAIVDPEETGLVLGGQLDVLSDVSKMEQDGSKNTANITSRLWFESDDNLENQTEFFEEPGIQLVSSDEQNNDNKADTSEDDKTTNETNVVHFLSKNSDSGGLSKRENEAFKTIGNKLREIRKSTPDTSLLEELPVAILIYREGQTLFANHHFLEAAGYDSIESLSEAGDIEGLLRPPLDEVNADSTYKLVRSNGEFASINPVLNTVPWDEEKALQLSFIPPAISPVPLPDILEMTQVSEIQSILDTTSDGVILLKLDGEIISINASAEALLNRGFDEVTGRHFTELFSKTSHSKVIEYLDSLAEPGVKSLLQEGREVEVQEANGGLIPVFLTLAKLESSGKLCAVVQDLTSWKKTEQELVKSRRDAERANEQKSDFLAQVSHEIRTPLNAIIGFSDIMIEERFGVIDNERYREYLNDINRSGKHVLELVNDLLDLSKIEAGKLELTFDAVNLNEIVAEAVAMLQPHANSNRIIVRTSLSRSVPKVVADIRSIRQVVLNLVTNAIKFSEPNSQVIVSTVYESTGEVAMRVRDTGDGMSEQEISDALKPYHQLNTVTERTHEGTGLGLPLTKALVEANRAFFDLESISGEGTIAHVQFPTQRVLTD